MGGNKCEYRSSSCRGNGKDGDFAVMCVGSRPIHSLRLLYAKGLRNVGTASGVNRPGRGADHNIVARFRMSGAIFPPPLYAIMVYMGTASGVRVCASGCWPSVR